VLTWIPKEGDPVEVPLNRGTTFLGEKGKFELSYRFHPAFFGIPGKTFEVEQ